MPRRMMEGYGALVSLLSRLSSEGSTLTPIMTYRKLILLFHQRVM